MLRWTLTICGLAVTLTAVATADDSTSKPVDVGAPNMIALEPAAFTLQGGRARQQLIVTGLYSGNDLRDLTQAATFGTSNPKVARIEGSTILPVGNGDCQITALLNGITATVNCSVKQIDVPSPVSFKNETQMALTKSGCNMGACHGSPSGKGGFRLSLRAYDPVLDIMTLRSEFFGRRINIMEPSESLLLKKPLMDVAHGGGKRIRKGDPNHRVLEQWIAEGLQLDAPTSANLLKIETLPAGRVLRFPADRQQIVVMGHFSDGSARDLTPLTDFSSSSESIGSVSVNGLVTKHGRGETAVLARYLDKMATCQITFLEDVPGFAWNNPPEYNFVDTRVFEKLKTLQIAPSDLCTDDEFLRRAYLDTTGRLPTIAEAQAFHQDISPSKRQVLVDALLDTNDFASYWSLKWSDLLRSNSKKLQAAGVHKFRRWVFENVRDDRPMDQFARDL
ncbi:MAG: DUF1549 domain-containing protein, partial [Planctomycetaceae bacterium]|nr:DUF1549 domain-containing protein [Planctomycetaceae bacterium]